MTMTDTIILTQEQRHILQHTLGMNYRPKHKRNFYVVEGGTSIYDACEKLVEVGLMRKGRTLGNNYFSFHATEEGIRHA